MTNHLRPNEWAKEFQDFMSAEEVHPPKLLFEKIFSQVKRDLNPSAWLVFSKLALIHTLVGTFTLLFCPQFGIFPFSGMGLMGILMRFGDKVCMLGCGAVFMGGSALMASLLLTPEQVRVIRKNKTLQLSVLALLSLGVFICTGVGIVLSLAAFWFLGSVLGGLLTLELGWMVRSHFRKKLVHGL